MEGRDASRDGGRRLVEEAGSAGPGARAAQRGGAECGRTCGQWNGRVCRGAGGAQSGPDERRARADETVVGALERSAFKERKRSQRRQ